ncbi:endonuclease/exonuclease/phosphatase family protein [Pareuzebyella sediminis]|uniref:endonuclease/exonuclease/phosphatase family protein n=1 Tax=Pareuzebyella sediminis TaxID=2607998 RepID=UPI0011EEF5BE|nr:endonuclease/exonuclease/phosphatase family protein [Pareuzebyella sediminis]
MRTCLLSILIFAILTCNAQKEKNYEIRTIAFYNVENLFDTKDDSLTFDDDRTPEGKDHWSPERYRKKIDNISKVLSEIGSTLTGTSPDILGLCEVENLRVIEDLVHSENLKGKNYGIVHFESPDERGIDVALLFKKNIFLPISFASRRLLLFDEDGVRNYTRDQLIVAGLLDNEKFYFIVNHWPSRSGGEARSRPNRIAAAKLNQHLIDSIRSLDVDARIISMGDFNDDPINDSFKKVLKTVGKENNLETGDLYNPMEKLFRKGIGSLAYRDSWNLFDQIYFTENVLEAPLTSYRFWKAKVFNKHYLVSKKGKYKGYPFRTYSGGSYAGGYSDHFPVFIYLIRNSPIQHGKGE